jgi:hypothetical protein
VAVGTTQAGCRPGRQSPRSAPPRSAAARAGALGAGQGGEVVERATFKARTRERRYDASARKAANNVHPQYDWIVLAV